MVKGLLISPIQGFKKKLPCGSTQKNLPPGFRILRIVEKSTSNIGFWVGSGDMK